MSERVEGAGAAGVSVEIAQLAREVVETYTVRWVALHGPIRCVCGHDHYGRVPSASAGYAPPSTRMAPQWWMCEDENCGCSSLRHVSNRPESPTQPTAAPSAAGGADGGAGRG